MYAIRSYYAIIDLGHNRMVGCEALARWTGDDGKVHSIGEVIDTIEADETMSMDLTTRMLGFIRKDLAPLPWRAASTRPARCSSCCRARLPTARQDRRAGASGRRNVKTDRRKLMKKREPVITSYSIHYTKLYEVR